MVTKDEVTIKIIDFGSCKDMEGTEFEKKFDEERKKLNSRKPTYKNFVGTPNYMAPECVRNKNSDYRSDMWSLGCLLYFLYVGFPPFLGKSDYLVFINSTEAKYSFPEGIVPPLAQDLISNLIVVDPTKRLTMEQVYDHPYLREENNDPKFRHKYPIFTLKEHAFLKIQKSLKKKYSQYKDISQKIERIKKYEEMEEECKRNNIEEDKSNPNTAEDKKLVEEKSTLLEKYNSGLEQLKQDIIEIKHKVQSSAHLVNKFNQLEKQLKHDMFKLDYEEQVKVQSMMNLVGLNI
jgi:serine/threonine protein kinase